MIGRLTFIARHTDSGGCGQNRGWDGRWKAFRGDAMMLVVGVAGGDKSDAKMTKIEFCVFVIG